MRHFHPLPEDIAELVARYFRMPVSDLCKRSRKRSVLIPRQLAMYMCRFYTDATLSDIARCFGREHPSVINAIRKIENPTNRRLQWQATFLSERLEHLGYTRQEVL